MLAGPVVPPGRYRVQLTVGDQTSAEWFELRKDPRVAASQEDLEAQCTLLLRIRDKLSETHDAINQIRDLKGQIDGWERRLATRTTTPAESGSKSLLPGEGGSKSLLKEARDAAEALKATLAQGAHAAIQSRADIPLR